MTVAFEQTVLLDQGDNLWYNKGQTVASIIQAGRLEAKHSESGKEHINRRGDRKQHSLKMILEQML